METKRLMDMFGKEIKEGVLLKDIGFKYKSVAPLGVRIVDIHDRSHNNLEHTEKAFNKMFVHMGKDGNLYASSNKNNHFKIGHANLPVPTEKKTLGDAIKDGDVIPNETNLLELGMRSDRDKLVTDTDGRCTGGNFHDNFKTNPVVAVLVGVDAESDRTPSVPVCVVYEDGKKDCEFLWVKKAVTLKIPIKQKVDGISEVPAGYVGTVETTSGLRYVGELNGDKVYKDSEGNLVLADWKDIKFRMKAKAKHTNKTKALVETMKRVTPELYVSEEILHTFDVTLMEFELTPKD